MPVFNPVPVFDFTVLFFETVDERAATVLGEIVRTPIFGSFQKVSGLTAELELEEYREGGRNAAPHRFARWSRYPSITFSRGVTPNRDLFLWYSEVRARPHAPPRKHGVVILHDRAPGLADSPTGAGIPVVDRIPIAAWYFFAGLPERVEGPGLDAQQNELAVEQLVIAHERLSRVSPTDLPSLPAVVASLGV